MSRIVGIDLGTTHSLIGVIEGGRPRLFEDETGSVLVPSIVAFTDSETLVGNPAKDFLRERPDRVLFSAKRFLGRGKNDVAGWSDKLPFDFSGSDEGLIRFRVGERTVTPIEVASLVLRKLKTMAEKTLGESVAKAVVTVPAYFNDAQRQATKFAGELAGLEVVRILNEPTAAALAYGLDKKNLGHIAVFDLGGGTFDISILRVQGGIFEVLSTNGDTALGGDDFDMAIAEALGRELLSKLGVDVWKDRALKTEWVLACEKLKRILSGKSESLFEFTVGDKKFSRVVASIEIESWISPILERVMAPCRQCLLDSKLKIESITDVILVGGSTRLPPVREKVRELFKREPICTLNPDEVVAMGAAVQANILAGQNQGMLLLDVTPLSLGIETVGGIVSKLIHRNSTVPTSASEHFTTYVDGQVSVDIHVLQGERELVKDNRSLARFQLKGLPPFPAGFAKIEVEFILDANGLLSVRATELRTSKSASIAVNPSYGLNDTEVERMLSESFEHAEADFTARFLAEARMEADGLLRATQKSLKKAGELLEPGEDKRIHAAMRDLETVLSQTATAEIKKKMEILNEETRSFAERLLNHAVKNALENKELT